MNYRVLVTQLSVTDNGQIKGLVTWNGALRVFAPTSMLAETYLAALTRPYASILSIYDDPPGASMLKQACLQPGTERHFQHLGFANASKTLLAPLGLFITYPERIPFPLPAFPAMADYPASTNPGPG